MSSMSSLTRWTSSRVTTRWSTRTRCLYYQHAVDRCDAYGRPGHVLQRRTILVGYACDEHARPESSSGYDYGDSTTSVEPKHNDVHTIYSTVRDSTAQSKNKPASTTLSSSKPDSSEPSGVSSSWPDSSNSSWSLKSAGDALSSEMSFSRKPTLETE